MLVQAHRLSVARFLGELVAEVSGSAVLFAAVLLPSWT